MSRTNETLYRGLREALSEYDVDDVCEDFATAIHSWAQEASEDMQAGGDMIPREHVKAALASLHEAWNELTTLLTEVM